MIVRDCSAYQKQKNIESGIFFSLKLEGIVYSSNKGNNKITELRTILQRESQNS